MSITPENKSLATRSFDIEEIRADFPILATEVHGKPLVYLDNAASTQKPLAVIEAISNYYKTSHANIHRGVHYLSEKATKLHDDARESVRSFLNAEFPEEIIFVRGATEAINLVAHSYGTANFKPGTNIVISAMEHHSNIVPWQIIADRTGAKLQVIPIDKKGVLDMDHARKLLAENAGILAIVHVSNALGTINPVKELIEIAHSHGVPVLVDGAQSAPHLPVDVRELDADFFVMSGHKVYGPTGIGVLYGRRSLLEAMPPYQGGGDMIRSVIFEKSTWNDLPYKFEAGTPDMAGAIGLAAALDYIKQFDPQQVIAHEDELLRHATNALREIENVRIIGEAPEKTGAISFVVENVHPHDLGTFLDHDGVAIRTGHHCAQPVMDFFDIPATARLSFALYNTRQEIDTFSDSLRATVGILS